MIENFPAWLAVGISALSLAYSMLSGRSRATAQKIANHDERLEGAEGRLTTIEADLKHLPDKDATHRLEISMADLNAEVRVLTERIKPVAAISDRLQEVLLGSVSRS